MDSHRVPDETLAAERWCAGLRFSGTRALEPAEIAALQVLAQHLLVRWRLVMAAWAFLLVAPLGLAFVSGPFRGWGETTLVVALIVGWVLGLPVLGMLAHDLWRARARQRDDLRQAQALVFDAPAESDPTGDTEHAELEGLGVWTNPAASATSLAVLAVTQRVLYRDVRGHWQTHAVHVREVAPPPRYAMRVPVPRELASTTIPGAGILKRSLHAGERDEIEQYVGRLRRIRPAHVFLASYGVLCAVMLVVKVRERAAIEPGDGFAAVLAVALGMRAIWLAVGAFRRAALLRRDLELGWVFTLQTEVSTAGIASHASAAPRPREAEFLPNSMAAWSENGRPAPWRNLRLSR